jgi:hypothetical protein
LTNDRFPGFKDVQDEEENSFLKPEIFPDKYS